MNRLKITLVPFLLFLLLYNNQCSAIGNGTVDISGVYISKVIDVNPTYEVWQIKGTVDYAGFVGSEDELAPLGYTYLSLGIFVEGKEPSSVNCSGNVDLTMCNVYTDSNRPKLANIYDTINRKASKNLPEPYLVITVLKGTKIGRLCSQWILLKAGDNQYEGIPIGQKTCGIAPPNIRCNLSPQQITVDLGVVQANNYTEGKSEVVVNCTGGSSDIKLVTLGNGDGSDVNLTGGQGNLTANLTLNGQAAGGGLKFNVPAEGSVTVNVEAKVQTQSDSSGTYQGSVPLIMSYE